MRDILTRLADAAGLLANQVQIALRTAPTEPISEEMTEAALAATDTVNRLVLEAHAELRGFGGQPAFVAQETILEEAGRLTSGERPADYGHPIDDFTRTGRLWGALLGLPQAVSPEQVGLCMVAVKLSRQCNRPKRDNLVDGAGYLRTVEMIERERERRAVDVEQDAADYHRLETSGGDINIQLTDAHTVEKVGSVMLVSNQTEKDVLQFLGYLSAEIPELRAVEVPRLADAWDRFKATPRREPGGKKYLVFTDSWPTARIWADSHQLSSYDWDWVSDRSDLAGRSPPEYEGVLLSLDEKSGAAEAWAEWQSRCG